MSKTLVFPRLVAAVATVAFAVSALPVGAEEPPKEFSPAERALFMTDQFATLRPPTTLRYRFRHAGSQEAGFDDKVSLALTPHEGGRCCDAAGEFLSGDRKVVLPPVESAVGNPVTLYFLERDVREMQRLTTGKSPYFRKRIRMAIFEGAQQRAVNIGYRGKTVAGQEFSITPYAEDPNRPRFEQLANKRYVFTLSDAVPGGIYAIRSQVSDTAKGADAPPLLSDELLIDGADAAPAAKAGS